MTRYIYCDSETYSPVPITNGPHAYAEKAEVMLFAYAVGDGPVHCLDLTAPGAAATLEKLKKAFQDPDTWTVWHNSGFDRTVIRHALGIELPLERVHDTMVQALAHGLPGSLDTLGEIFRLDVDSRKLKVGRELINLFCKPQARTGKRNDRFTHPEKWTQFIEYAKQDIKAMRVLKDKMPMWNYTGRERELWELDQRINDRGFAVDLELADGAIAAVEREQKRLAKRTKDVTNGNVERATQRAEMLKHILAEYGVNLPDLTGATIERRMQDPDLPLELKELLSLRQQASTTSTSKYKTLAKAASTDGRLRGSLQFCGASRTGRWAGRLFQPQNLPRPKLKQKAIEAAIADIKAGVVDFTHDNVMEAISACVRGCIHAPHGKKLVVSDLSNIEGRMAAWLAGETWKLKAFADYDKGVGADLYRVAYAKAFQIPVEQVDGGAEKGPHRQIGKVMELMLQYEGGVGAFLTGAASYNIDLDAMATTAWPNIPDYIKSEANSFWGYSLINKRTLGLAEKTFVVCDSLKRMWREAHPAISSYWKELEDAAIKAIANPGVVITCRKLKLVKKGAWLRIILPSGRSLCYAGAQVAEGKISYMGINQYSRKWERTKTYGGKLFENVTQAASRDVMGENMPIIEAEGYLIILSVHDELLTEAPSLPEFSDERLSALLSTNPQWAPDLPLAAGGFEAINYRKD